MRRQIRLRWRRAPLLAICALALSACSLFPVPTPSPDVLILRQAAEQEDGWKQRGIDDYTMLVGRSCFCPPQDPYEITVVDGVVTTVTSKGAPVPPAEVADIPTTVPALYALIRRLPVESLRSVRYELGPGIPSAISVDPVPNAVDDEYSIIVSALTPAS